MTKTLPNPTSSVSSTSSQLPPVGTCLKIPKTSNEFSSNWKSIFTVVKESDRQAKVKHSSLSKEGSTKKTKKPKSKAKKGVEASCLVGRTDRSINEPCGSEPLPKASANSEIPTKSNSETSLTNVTKCLAIDCEFVGVGRDGKDDMLARVSIVNLYGDCVYDKYVAPVEEVVDYRTAISGVRLENLVNAEKLKVVQKEVGDLIQGHVLVGHNVKKDLQMLFLSHPKKDLRDTSKYRPFRVAARTKWPSLKKLAGLILGVVIQTGEHDSVTDARVTMQLYRTQRKTWECCADSRKKKLIMKSNVE